MNDTIEKIKHRWQQGELTRILAFGSSNTERFLPGMHWFDCLDLAIKQKYGRVHHCINTGIGGNTTRDLLQRFERDAAFYQPHAVIITIGGNDCNPERDVSIEDFERNLLTLHQQFSALGTLVIFQTYYAVISDGSQRFLNFYKYSDIVRKVVAQTQSGLIDQLARWELLQQHYPDVYLPLMRDAFHVTPRGNRVMGVGVARAFDLRPQADLDFWAEALYAHQLMDQLVTAPYRDREGAGT
jgi:lysophospholipase L1-like esterase